jgi:hypothetical protein
MSQRDSGYARVAFDQYETPEWVTQALIPHIPERVKLIWEPACGSGKMSSVLVNSGYDVVATDIQSGVDFFHPDILFLPSAPPPHAIVTNPPYSEATAFALRSLMILAGSKGFVAMLLRTDFDHAKTRRRLFADHRAFAKKVILTKRIRWIEGSKGSPSFNHAWFIWDWQHQGAPAISYHFED